MARWEEALRRLTDARQVVVDVETSGLDWRKDWVCGWALGFGPRPEDNYYLPVRHEPGGNILDWKRHASGWGDELHPVEKEILAKLDDPNKTLIFHNASFDLKQLYNMGFQNLRPQFRDTMTRAALINEHQEKFSLEFCCQVAGVAAKKSQLIVDYICSKFPEAAKSPRNAMGFFHQLAGDDPVAVEYAEGDGVSTWQLHDWQNAQLAEQNLERVHDIESRLIPVLARMSGKGIKIDEARLEYLLHDPQGGIGARIDKLREQFPAEFNFRSPNDVQKWCTDHGQTNWPLTPKGKPSFASQWLETHEPGKQIILVRRLLTLRDTFLRPMQEEHLWKGRVHSTYNQLRGDDRGTITGRLSSSAPNLQAATKHDYEIGKLHRSIFIPDEGMVWANADFSQIEPRILAFYSRSKVLLEGYRANPPVDAHTAVSAAMNRDWGTMTKEERKHYRDHIGKRANMVVLTGGGKKVLTEKYGIPPDVVDQAWNDYHRAIPELKSLQRRAAQRMQENGFVHTLLGRRARLKDYNKAYVAVNRLLQGNNADAIKVKMVQIDEFLASEGRPIDMLNSVHDDLAFQFTEENRRYFDECLKIMVDFGSGQPIEFDVPITVDVGEGKNWAEASYEH